MDAQNHKGKIGFIYPAMRAADGFPSPTLNFISENGRVSMVIGTAFLDLNPGSSYIAKMELRSPNGKEILTSRGLDGIPPDHIHPEYRTTFLSADMYFDVIESGIYTFSCELWEMMATKVDEKKIEFNIHLTNKNATE